MRKKKPGRPPIGQEPLIHSATGLTQTQRDFVNSQRGGNFAERLRNIVDDAANSGCAVAAVNDGNG